MKENNNKFRELLQSYLRKSGTTQIRLAAAIIPPLPHQQLSNKLNSKGNARLIRTDVLAIIKAAAQLEIITVRAQAVELLAAWDLTEHAFSVHEWQTEPLIKLESPQSIYNGTTTLNNSLQRLVPAGQNLKDNAETLKQIEGVR